MASHLVTPPSGLVGGWGRATQPLMVEQNDWLEPGPMSVKMPSPNHWTAREAPVLGHLSDHGVEGVLSRGSSA